MLPFKLLRDCLRFTLNDKCRIFGAADSLLQLPILTTGYQARYQAVIRSSTYSYSTFNGVKDHYKGITVDTKTEPCEKDDFAEKLAESLIKWENDARRCIWFRVDIKDSFFVPVLAKNGFNFHHARDDFVMMFKWLPKDTTPNLPPSCHLNLGVGAMVLNTANKLLAITEKHYNYPHWKLPGGYVEKGEDIIDAAVREVKEETGIDTVFSSIVTFRHTHNAMFGNSDMYVLVRLDAVSEEIKISQREIKDCKWMDIEEYTNHEHVHAFNKFIINKALEYKAKNVKLDFKKKTVTWATYTRDMNYLIVEGV